MAGLYDTPEAAEFGQFRAAVAQMKGGNGKPLFSQQQLSDAVGEQVNGRNWNEIRDDLRDFIAGAPSVR